MHSYSRLESLPGDILRYIVLLAAEESAFDSVGVIFSMLQTCSTFYHGLNTHNAADLYSNIFSLKFDTSASYRRYCQSVTDSAQAGKLVNRCRLLHRVKQVHFIAFGLLEDLWTALWMLLENDGRNEQHLSSVNFSGFLWALMRTVLGPHASPVLDSQAENQYLQHITVWILCLSLRRRVILDMSKASRNELYDSVFPFIFDSNKIAFPLSFEIECSPRSGLGCPSDQDLQGDGLSRANSGTSPPPYGGASCAASSTQTKVSTYLRSLAAVPDPSTAAINIACAILEATPLQVPPHLNPELRVAMGMEPLSVPDLESQRVTTQTLYRTLLPADVAEDAAGRVAPRAMFGFQFHEALQISSGHGAAEGLGYVPGMLSGLWEGALRILPVPSSTGSDGGGGVGSSSGSDSGSRAVGGGETFLKPMQLQLVEYICIRDNSSSSAVAEDDTFDAGSLVYSFDTSAMQITLGGRVYNKYQVSPTPGHDHGSSGQGTPVYDVILRGEVDTHFLLRRPRLTSVDLRGPQPRVGSVPVLREGAWTWRHYAQT